MYSSEFLDALHNHAPVFSETPGSGVIEHFGDVEAEFQALQSRAVVCPLAEFCRLQVSGRDRAKYLHNFCTNNIKDLSTGQICEAFFTDVKAKILAHGYVAAFDDAHEIWMLPGDEEVLINHLNRYIITEDVSIASLSEQQSTLVVMGPEAESVLAAALSAPGESIESGCCYAADGAAVLTSRWHQLPVVFLSTSRAGDLWQNLITAGATPAGAIIFDHQRILEGFPIVGIDISTNHLAPEADRNSQAISYTKGCYLGQEPIARLDAIGHVNRKLYRCHVTPTVGTDHAADLPSVTSRSRLANDEFPALTSLPVKLVSESQRITARCPDNTVVTVRVVPASQT